MIVLSACYSHSGSCCPLATSSVIIIITIMTINIMLSSLIQQNIILLINF